ncbi:hypothetical protein [Xylanimonas ulmi]|uniref:hypothetical protein n=1 Tax=Xylanimonas ulmi TaxID=228973 RepID=UPI00102ACB20|nr:hypothetical protein [Xylanibacterium ulmi]
MRDSRLFLSLFGIFARHGHLRDLEPAEFEADPYRALVHAAAGAGWNLVGDDDGDCDDGDGQPTAPWTMGEASPRWSESTRGTNVAWFQLQHGLCPTPTPTPLPIPQLLTAALAPARRLGALTLTGVQTLVPVHLAGDAGDCVYAVGRAFAMPSCGPRASVRVTIDSGDADDVVRGACVVGTYLRFLLGPLVASLRALGRGFDAQGPTPVLAYFPAGGHRITFEADVAEWSDAAVTLLVAAAAEACREAGVRRSVLIDVVAIPRRGVRP